MFTAIRVEDLDLVNKLNANHLTFTDLIESTWLLRSLWDSGVRQ